jgi:hypothetical protein
VTQASLFDQPRARFTDPDTSRMAAEIVSPGNGALINAIRKCVYLYGPLTAWEIADKVAGTRWQYDTVRSACARAGLRKIEGTPARSPGGRPCCLYSLDVESTDAL